ncbi:universal stress protein [Halalkalirubrum salinum]|uniref:universal stress protein n=1 Tax=Halalkalirubrum salinum TaxID=2563889 RepID=UPI0010FB226A|nr:universal stress protein [Halalkalirubrum salinum]
MYRVLIPVDESEERAFHQAQYVSQLPNATTNVEATVLFVVSPEEFSNADEVEFSDIDAAVGAANLLEGEGVSVTRTVDDGGVSQQIVRSADELDADEIVMGGRKRSGVSRVLLGSTVQDVMLSADRPVTITSETTVPSEGIRQVLVPVDADADRAQHQAAYVAGLPEAAATVEATVLVVFRHQDYKGAPPHTFDEIGAAVEAADVLEDEGIPVERVAIGGEVARKILHMAAEKDADSIVMGGRKRSGLQEVLMGSITQDVMLSAERPVTITG